MRRIVILTCFLTSLVHAQHLISLGVKGGVPLSDGFSDRTSPSDATLHSFSDSKKFVIGPMVELHLPLGLSIEADALYHPLDLTMQPQVSNVFSGLSSSINVKTFEFPILGKYRFLHTPVVKPYVEAGPIFRTVSSQTSYMSNKGFAIGAGVDFKLLLVTVTPELRYTRWGSDTTPRGVIVYPSNQNQGQFLIGLSF
jgi:hypothetical protein